MFCPNCAQSVADNARFCEYCGFPLTKPEVAPEVTTEPSVPVESSAATVEEQSVASNEQPTQSAVVVPPTQPTPVSQQPSQPTVSYQQAAPAPVNQPAPQQTPAYQQAPQYQQVAGAPQPPAYQQTAAYPQAPTYQQAAAPAQTEKKSVTSQLWFKILIGLLIALAVYGVGMLIYNNWIRALINNNSSSQTSTTTNIDVLDIFGFDTGSKDILDSNNNLTAYALQNTSGADITNALEEIGWEFNEDSLIWLSEDGNSGFYVCGEDDYEFTKEDIKNMPANGGNEPTIMTVYVDDYDYESIDDVIANLVQGEVLDQEEVYDGVCLLMRTESGETDFVYVMHSDYLELYRYDVANENAITCGYAEDFFGVEGETLEDFWYDLTGRSINND